MTTQSMTRLMTLGVFVSILFLFGGEVTQAAGCSAATVRHASSSNRIYISGAGTSCTIPELYAIRPNAPLAPVAGETDVWLLGANVIISDGARLDIHGPEVSELRLKSNNTGSISDDIVYIRAHFGTIDIKDTKIISWDEAAGGPDTEYGSNRRSYIQARSFEEGTTARESRMDIMNSEISHLGYHGAEAYGLSWKVNGTDPTIFDRVDVFGDIQNSQIHHNYFGVYTYGHFGGTWTGNTMYDNVVYGFDPHDDSDELTISDNEVYGNGSHGIICSKRCNDLVITNNNSHNNGGNGIMLHRDANDSLVANNTLTDNGDSGVALFESHRNVVRDNTMVGNKRGIRLSVGSADNEIVNNWVQDSTTYAVFTYKGSDIPVSGDGRPHDNLFRDNTFHGSAVHGVKLKEGDRNRFENNTFTDNGKDLLLDDSHENVFVGNSVSGNSHYGIRMKNGSSRNVIDDNTITNNGKAGVYVAAGGNENEVRNNNITSHNEYGIRVLTATDNVFESNTITDNRRGVNLRDDADNNEFTDNIVDNNDQYPFYIQASSGNVMTRNSTVGNGKYYYARNDSDNTIVDVGQAVVKSSDSPSSFTIISTNREVLVNDRDIPSTLFTDRAELVLTRAVERNAVNFSSEGFMVTPNSNGLATVVLAEDYEAGEDASWDADATGSVTTSYVLDGFDAGDTYTIERNGSVLTTVVANGAGELVFDDTLSDGDSFFYEVD